MEAQSHRPPASQASGRVFRDSAERSLRVFVEASDLLHRPKVIHILKSNGATIAHAPDEAAIIIVDPQTPSGRQFIEEWGAEPGKVVLDVPWVQKSVERGRAFIADESWGGFCLSENATSTGTVQESPLPTPRDTPPDAPASQAEFSMQNQPPYYPPGGSQFNPPNAPLGYPFQQQVQQGQMGHQMPNGLPNGAPIPPAGMQDPNAQVILPAHIVAQLVGLASQQGLNPASLGMPQMVPQMGNQMPMHMMQGQPMPQGYPFMPQPGMFVQPQYPLSQQHGIYLPQQMMPPPSPMSQMHPPDADSPNHYQSPTPATPDRRLSESLSRRQGSMSDTAGSPMQDVRPTSRKRKSPATEKASTSGRRSGKGRADGERSTKQRRVSYPSEEAPLLYPDATPHSPQPVREPSSSLGKLFAQEDGEPYKFYVQIDIRPRTKIADAIKKNGGKLVPDIADADYVILGSHSSRTFEERLKQAGNYGKLAVRPQWVFECVEQNEIVELDEFVFEGIQVEKKRGRPSALGKRFILTGPNAPPTKVKAKASQQLQDSDEEEMAEDEGADESDETDDTLMKKQAKSVTKHKAAPKETAKKEKAEKKADKPSARSKSSTGEGTSKGSKAKAVAAKSTERRSPSAQTYWRPSPPPPTRVVEHTPGKNMYTKEDMDYVDEYLPILFFRDPDITWFAISEKLHAKMPHHTQKSWQTHITHANRRERVERMRRQAHIARRKAAASGVQRTSQSVDPNASEATQTAPAPAQPTVPQPSIDMFEALANFFAGGGADNLADTEVWNEVHRKHPELSAEAWEAYWMKHNHEIAAAVRRISGVTDSEAPMQYGDGHIVPKPEPE